MKVKFPDREGGFSVCPMSYGLIGEDPGRYPSHALNTYIYHYDCQLEQNGDTQSNGQRLQNPYSARLKRDSLHCRPPHHSLRPLRAPNRHSRRSLPLASPPAVADARMYGTNRLLHHTRMERATPKKKEQRRSNRSHSRLVRPEEPRLERSG